MSDKITRVPVPPTRSPRLIPRKGRWLGDIKASEIRVGDVVCHKRMLREQSEVDDHGVPFIPVWECRVVEAETTGPFRRLRFRWVDAPDGEPDQSVLLRLDEPVLLVDGPVADPERDAVAEERAAFIGGLRRLADLLEQVPQIPTPVGGYLAWPVTGPDEHGLAVMESVERELCKKHICHGTTTSAASSAISVQMDGLHFRLQYVRDRALEEYRQRTSYAPNVQVTDGGDQCSR